MYSSVKPGLDQNPPNSLKLVDLKPTSSCSSRMAAASGSSPSSISPAGTSSKCSFAGCLYCRTNKMLPSPSMGAIATAALCSTTSLKIFLPDSSVIVSRRTFKILPSYFLSDRIRRSILIPSNLLEIRFLRWSLRPVC